MGESRRNRPGNDSYETVSVIILNSEEDYSIGAAPEGEEGLRAEQVGGQSIEHLPMPRSALEVTMESEELGQAQVARAASTLAMPS